MKKKSSERLSDILKRFRGLSYTSQVFATEHDAKKFGYVHPEELRAMLLHELKFLKSQHAAFEKVWSRTFKSLEAELKHSKDADLRERLHRVHEDLRLIRRSLFRSELAGWSDRELLDEWNEWERMKRFSAQHANREGIRKERQELLRSELALRGYAGKVTGDVLSEKREKPAEPRPSRKEHPVSEAVESETPHTSRELFSEWDHEFREMVEAEAAYWQEALIQIEDERAMGAQAVPVLKKHKRAQAEKRQLKKAFGY